ncbi:transketolase, partial [Vibrio cholerae HC-55B2]
SDCDRL